MNSFLLMVQTGLLAYISQYGSRVRLSNVEREREPIWTALADAIRIECTDTWSFENNIQYAKEFVEWATRQYYGQNYGTDFAWIETVLGRRTAQSY